MIVDEVQTGGGFSGEFWAHTNWNLTTPPGMVWYWVVRYGRIYTYFGCTWVNDSFKNVSLRLVPSMRNSILCIDFVTFSKRMQTGGYYNTADLSPKLVCRPFILPCLHVFAISLNTMQNILPSFLMILMTHIQSPSPTAFTTHGWATRPASCFSMYVWLNNVSWSSVKDKALMIYHNTLTFFLGFFVVVVVFCCFLFDSLFVFGRTTYLFMQSVWTVYWVYCHIPLLHNHQ